MSELRETILVEEMLTMPEFADQIAKISQIIMLLKIKYLHCTFATKKNHTRQQYYLCVWNHKGHTNSNYVEDLINLNIRVEHHFFDTRLAALEFLVNLD